MPPAACQVEPDVSSDFSTRTTSDHPALVRWYSTEQPTTPPPITTTCADVFTVLPPLAWAPTGTPVSPSPAFG